MNASVPAALLATAVLAASGPAGATQLPIEGPFGSGADGVWILRPQGSIRAIVVFGHGWKQAPPSPDRPWVGQFAAWLAHLLARGDAVIFPRYQLGGDLSGPARVASYRAGLAAGFARLGRPAVPVVAAGYSYGGSLAFYYAANARSWGLPEPAAVDGFFPAGVIGGAPLPPLPASVRVLVQVGDRDVEAGAGAASSLWAWLRGHPRRRYEVVASHGSFTATHAAPKGTTADAQRAFWAPLDRMVDSAVGG